MNPCVKVRYPTRKAAKRAGKRIEKRKSEKMNVYRCDQCEWGWHTGHMSLRKMKGD